MDVGAEGGERVEHRLHALGELIPDYRKIHRSECTLQRIRDRSKEVVYAAEHCVAIRLEQCPQLAKQPLVVGGADRVIGNRAVRERDQTGRPGVRIEDAHIVEKGSPLDLSVVSPKGTVDEAHRTPLIIQAATTIRGSTGDGDTRDFHPRVGHL